MKLDTIVKEVFAGINKNLSRQIDPLLERKDNELNEALNWEDIDSIINAYFKNNNIMSEIENQLSILTALKFYDLIISQKIIKAINRDIKSTFYKKWNQNRPTLKETGDMIRYKIEIPIKREHTPEHFELHNAKTGEKIPTIKNIGETSTTLTITNYEMVTGPNLTVNISCPVGDKAKISYDENNTVKGACITPSHGLINSEKDEENNYS